VKRLGIKAEVARFLASKELIETNASKDQGKISKPFTREGLLLFESKYSFAIDVAQELGITTSFLIQRLQTLNVRPVSGKAVDGGPHYVLRRVDLESVDLKKLSTMFPRKKTKKNLIRQVVHGGNRIALKRTPSKTGPYILRCYRGGYSAKPENLRVIPQNRYLVEPIRSRPRLQPSDQHRTMER
jgi:hypothetical protein